MTREKQDSRASFSLVSVGFLSSLPFVTDQSDGTGTEKSQGGGFWNWREKQSVGLPVPIAVTNNLSAIVDGFCGLQCPGGRRYKGVQVYHKATAVEECVRVVFAADIGSPHDLSDVVDSENA